LSPCWTGGALNAMFLSRLRSAAIGGDEVSVWVLVV